MRPHFPRLFAVMLRTVIILATLASLGYSGEINLSGIVYTQDAKPAFGIGVALRRVGLVTTTGPDGTWKLGCPACLPDSIGADSLILSRNDSTLEIVPVTTFVQSGIAKIVKGSSSLQEIQSNPGQFVTRSDVAAELHDQIARIMKSELEREQRNERSGRKIRNWGFGLGAIGTAAILYAANSKDKTTQIVSGGIGGGLVAAPAILIIPMGVSKMLGSQYAQKKLNAESVRYKRRLEGISSNSNDQFILDSMQLHRNAIITMENQEEKLRYVGRSMLVVGGMGLGLAAYGFGTGEFLDLNTTIGLFGVTAAVPGLLGSIIMSSSPEHITTIKTRHRQRLTDLEKRNPHLAQSTTDSIPVPVNQSGTKK